MSEDIKAEDYYQVRVSPVILIFKIIENEIVYLTVYLLLRALYYYFPYETFSYLANLEMYLFISTFAIHLFNVITNVWLTLNWSNSYYLITEKSIAKRQGVFYTSERIFNVERMESIAYTQGLLGKLFNYGTIRIFNPALKEDIILKNIPEPEKFTALIKQKNKSDALLRFVPKRIAG